MWAEPFLQLFIPDAACLECSYCGGFLGIDMVMLLKPARPNVMIEGVEAAELMMKLEALVPSLCDHL